MTLKTVKNVAKQLFVRSEKMGKLRLIMTVPKRRCVRV